MTVEPANWTAQECAAFMARRQSRNRALGILLSALAVLFFGITVVRMAGQPLPAPPGTTPPATTGKAP